MGGFVAELGELLERIFLGVIEVLGNLNPNTNMEVAPTAA
jgi:hypothetical protein